MSKFKSDAQRKAVMAKLNQGKVQSSEVHNIDYDIADTIVETPGLTKQEKDVLINLNWRHYAGYHWSVGQGDTKYVMTALGYSRKKADDLIMKVLRRLDKKYGY